MPPDARLPTRLVLEPQIPVLRDQYPSVLSTEETLFRGASLHVWPPGSIVRSASCPSSLQFFHMLMMLGPMVGVNQLHFLSLSSPVVTSLTGFASQRILGWLILGNWSRSMSGKEILGK